MTWDKSVAGGSRPLGSEATRDLGGDRDQLSDRVC